ncbi:GlyGly-CTERM sorting domain-containing protein [Sphingomonas sp. ZB1N12]|uniref:GlyGly-CTERM sorting domain-containing protein n=1 Tax=Sphingomonas arabinosi TaxID=3096160 RepID=UPI003FA6BE34
MTATFAASKGPELAKRQLAASTPILFRTRFANPDLSGGAMNGPSLLAMMTAWIRRSIPMASR